MTEKKTFGGERKFIIFHTSVNFDSTQKKKKRHFSCRSQFTMLQCRNCRNSLSHFFHKNFLKALVLLKKLLNTWLDKFFFSEREFLVFPHCECHSVEKREIHCHANLFSSIQFRVKFFSKMFISQNFCEKDGGSKIPYFPNWECGTMKNLISPKKIFREINSLVTRNFFSKTLIWRKNVEFSVKPVHMLT